MPVINGVYLKDFPALPSSVADANIIPIAISGNQIAYRTTVAGIVTDARVTSKLLTGLSVTGSTILATDTILQAFGKVQNQLNGKVSSVGLTMPAAFNVANSPITSAGTLAVTAAGVASQYIRGDGALADFPTSTGGGSSVAYYLNGSVNQGTFVGNTYYEMNKTPVIGAGTDFTINANGYIAQFITDANDPASLLIPAGNWNVEMYFSASSNGGTPSFYVEVYKYDGTAFTLLGSSSATPEGITNGTAIDIYYTSVGIPETVLTLTDRLAIRVYVTHSGRTITLHTEDNHLSEIVTTFSNGLTTLNGLTKQSQYFAVGSTGTDFAIVSSVDTHTFNIPSASASNRGLITTGTQTIAGAKTFTGNSVFKNNDSGNPAVTFRNENGSGITAQWLTSANTVAGTIYNSGLISTTPQGDLYGSAINSFTSSQLAASLTDETGTGSVVFSASPTFTGVPIFGSSISNGTYTYTLPSATGTLALTSDIHSPVTLAAIGSTANANGATLTGQVLNLQPASASFGGVVTTGSQTIAGDKNFTGIINALAIQSNQTSGYAIFTNSITNGFGGYFGVSGTGSHSIYAGAVSGNSIQARNNSSTYETINVINDGSGNIATFGNSSGTKLTVSNLGALTGTTATFTNSGAGIGIDVTNSGSGDGIKITHSLGRAFRIESSSTGYGILINNLTASTSAPFTIQKQGSTVITMTDLGGATFNGAVSVTGQLSLGSTITNGTYTYTLPSATGTLALTSALSSYLPLSGGTLTGALSGTSATFTSGTTGPSTGITSIGDITAARTSTTGAIFLGTTGSKYLYYDGTKYILNASPLEVGGSITATSATFSSRVNVNGATDNSSYVIQGKGNVSSIDSNNQNTVFLAASPTASYLATSWIGGGGAVPLYIQNNGINALTISTTGAATFTGDVAISNTTSNKLTISGGSTQNGITLSAITGFGNNFYIFNGDGGLGNGFGIYNNTTSTLPFYISNAGAATFSSRVTTGGGDGKGIIIEANSSALTIPAIGFNIQTGYNVSYINSYNVSGVSNGIYIGSSLVNISSLGTGTVYSNAGTLTNTNPSDERLKENIKDLSWGLNEILQLKPVSYNWINDKINQGEQYGFIAQDVQKVIPELVKEFIIPANEELETKELVRLGLDKEAIFVGLVKAIQELKAEIDLLKGEPIIPTDNNLE